MKFSRKELLLVFLSALIIRTILFLAIELRNSPEGFLVYDSYGYLQIAHNLRESGAFSQDYTAALEPDYFRTPLYPVFLLFSSFTGYTVITSLLLQIIIGSLTALVVMHLSTALNASRKWSIAAGLLMALEPASICFTSLILTETIFVFLFSLSMLYLIRFIQSRENKHLYIFTAFFSVALLTRPVAAYLGLILLPFLYFIRPGKLKPIFYSFLLFAVICAPWFIRNTIIFGKPFLTLLDDQMLLFYHASSIVAEKDGITLQDAQSMLWRDALESFQGDPKKDVKEFSEHVRDKAAYVIRRNSGTYIKQHAAGVFSILFKPVRGYIDAQLGMVKGFQSVTPGEFPANQKMLKSFFAVSSSISIAMVLLQILILGTCYILFIPGVRMISKDSMFTSLLLLITVFYFINMVVPPFSEGRLRLPIIPLLIATAAAGITSFKKRV